MVESTTLSVHRCRFVDFTPSAITSIAFPPLRLPSIKGKKKAAIKKQLPLGILAIGRANGNIELCEWTGSNSSGPSPQAWVVKKTLIGPFSSKADSLAFAIRDPDELAHDDVPSWDNLRLFSAGGGSDLVEWDIERGTIRRTIASQGGSIWSIAVNPASSQLALGCEDGSVRVLNLEHDRLSHLKKLDRIKNRILSIAWGPPVPRDTSKAVADISDSEDDDEDNDEWADSWIAAGCSDSSVRKWDIATGRVLERMTLDKRRGERTLVWTIGVLGDGTIVSGDSMGMVKFWDPISSTQLQSFQAHAADILCMTISPDGQAIYTSGVDQKVTQLSFVRTSQGRNPSNPNPSTSLLSRSPNRWIQTTSRRLHSHDVRAIAIWPPHSPLPPSHNRQFPLDIAPILASGGLDMSVVLTPAASTPSTATPVANPLCTSHVSTFEDSYHRRMAYCSGTFHSSALHVARQARLLLCVKEGSASIYRILKRRKKPSFDEDDGEVPAEVDLDTVEPESSQSESDGGWDKLLDMELSVQSNLTAGGISDDGKWVVVSDWYETKLFRITTTDNGDLKPKRIKNFTSLVQGVLGGTQTPTGGSSFCFSPDSRKLAMGVAMSGHILVIDLGDDSQTPRVLRKFEHHRTRHAIIKNRVVKGRTPVSAGQNEEDVEMAENVNGGGDDEDEDGGDETAVEESEDEKKTVLVTVTRMAVSPDGQWLATSDDRCRTHIFNLDSVQHHCILPSFPFPIHALSFDPSNPSVLAIGLANNTIQIYDVELQQFPSWAQKLTSDLPQRFTHLHDPILGVTFDPGASSTSASETPKRHALFWGATWLCKVVLDAEVGYKGFDKKRRRNGRGNIVQAQLGDGKDDSQENFKLITNYRPILFVDFLSPAELVVVERPLVDVMQKLPPAFFKLKYGAT